MTDEQKPLKDAEIGEVSGGGRRHSRRELKWEPYNDPHYPVSCINCSSSNIWYIKGELGIDALTQYWCKDCDRKFWDNERTYHGASNDW